MIECSYCGIVLAIIVEKAKIHREPPTKWAITCPKRPNSGNCRKKEEIMKKKFGFTLYSLTLVLVTICICQFVYPPPEKA